MDNRPIGIFDSGIGGLTCVPYMLKEFPKEKIVYFGDTARTPYGSKATSTIKKFSVQIADFLIEHDVKMIVIACNTVSAVCLELLEEKYPNLPIVDIIEPTAEVIANICSITNNVGIIGTKATINAGTYKKDICRLNNSIRVFEKSCPTFVPLIEEGIIENDIMEQMIEYYMDDFVLENRLDTIVMGCTHYPLLESSIKRKYPNLKIINPSKEIVWKIKEILLKKNMLADNSNRKNIFYASDLSDNFIKMIGRICENIDVNIEFKNLDIE